jgi:hypothetical protein
LAAAAAATAATAAAVGVLRLEGIKCVWLSAARKAAFSTRSWSTSARHSSQRRFASSAEASAASRSEDLDSRALTCLKKKKQ